VRGAPAARCEGAGVWRRLAAEQGNASAQYSLGGGCFERG
jgi:hypothetical protein